MFYVLCAHMYDLVSYYMNFITAEKNWLHFWPGGERHPPGKMRATGSRKWKRNLDWHFQPLPCFCVSGFGLLTSVRHLSEG
ncbi:hypothetical protein TgHK011_008861 [Trichoderma gracile]|nr:hypothetical protein TgHK011_008861 [Trichoderma gracile]